MDWNDIRRPQEEASTYRCSYDDEGKHCPSGTKAGRHTKDSQWNNCRGGTRYWEICYPKVENYSLEDKDKLECCLGFQQEDACHPDYCRKDGKSLGKCSSFVGAYCSKPENLFDATGCIRLKTQDPEIYKYVMKENCKGDNFNKTECKEFCRDNPNECQTELLEYCKDKFHMKQHEDVCACYYPPQVYLDIAQQFQTEWQVPAEHLDQRPGCAYPQCKTAFIGPHDTRECGKYHISSCINNIDIDVGGKATIGSVILTNDQECGNVYTKPVTPVTDPKEEDPKEDDEGGEEKNDGGFLGTGLSTTLGWYIVSGGALFLLLAGLMYIVSRRGNRSDEVAKTQLQRADELTTAHMNSRRRRPYQADELATAHMNSRRRRPYQS